MVRTAARPVLPLPSTKWCRGTTHFSILLRPLTTLPGPLSPAPLSTLTCDLRPLRPCLELSVDPAPAPSPTPDPV